MILKKVNSFNSCVVLKKACNGFIYYVTENAITVHCTWDLTLKVKCSLSWEYKTDTHSWRSLKRKYSSVLNPKVKLDLCYALNWNKVLFNYDRIILLYTFVKSELYWNVEKKVPVITENMNLIKSIYKTHG